MTSSEGTDGAESVLSRLGAGRDLATKEANRFFIFGLIFTLLYGAKIAGYDLDQIIINRDIGSLKNGSFVYLIASQVSITLCLIRNLDSAAIEHSIKVRLRDELDSNDFHISEVYPNAREWFSPISTKFQKTAFSGAWRVLFNITSLLTILVALGFFSLPVASGLYHIGNPTHLRFSSSPDIELTIVVVSTILCGLWIINSIGVSLLFSRLERGERGIDGDRV